MDVLLVNPKNIYEEEIKKLKNSVALGLYPPLGILYIASVLERNGISVKIVDSIASDYSLEQTVEIIKETNPKVLGITATTPQIRGAVQIAEKIKKKCENIIIGIGGAHVSADKNFIKRFKCFDFSVEGEGEITFSELVKKVLKREQIKGSFQGQRVENLDEIPFPARHLVNKKEYFIEPYGSSISTIHTTRGCPFNCVFCSKPVTCQTTRFRSPKNVVDEIEKCIKEDKVKMILFTDDTFTLNPKRTEEICQEILKKKIKLDWYCETRANLVDRKLLELMHKSGCREISFGVEVGNEKLRLEVVRKKVTDEDLIKAFDLCREIGIKTPAFCMLGFPGETRENIYETYKLCLRLKPTILGFHLITPMPGADIYHQAIREKKIAPDIWDQYAKGLIKDQPAYVPDKTSLKELKKIQKDIYHKYYFRPGYLFSRLLSDIQSIRMMRLDFMMMLNLLFQSKTPTGRQ